MANLILDRYRILGRAGAGGYATVQHAYDTRLKRDVAIKCIQISQADIVRTKVPVQDQRDSIALPQGNRKGAIPASGFVPMSAKLNEPSFFDKRDKQAEKRAKRRSFIGRPGIADTEDFEDEATDSESFDLSDFAGYSNFKGSSRGRSPRPSSAAMRHPSASRLDVEPNESNTMSFAKIAGSIPGRIDGAGEVDINGIDNDVVMIDPGQEPSSNRASGTRVREYAGNRPPLREKGQTPREDRRKEQPKRSKSRFSDHSDPTPLDISITEERIPGLEEARTAAHLNDANIVTVYDCIVEGNMAYVIMEYVEGKTLAKILRELGNDITLDMIASVFTSVSHALEVAHKANVLHLDIKPENVIVNNEGVVKVTDFGLSTLMDASGHGVTGGGTIGYMPLEQMRQQRLDVRTDEWALASLTYEMLSGKNPFKTRSLNDAERAIEEAELVVPSLCWEEIDPTVDDIMFEALSPDRDGRYGSIKRFSEDLTPLLGDAKEGKQQLSAAVKDAQSLREDAPAAPAKPAIPFIDRLGERGSGIVMRALAVFGAAMLAIVSLLNMRLGAGVQSAADASSQVLQSSPDTTYGLFSLVPIVAWVILAAMIAVAVWRPRYAMPAGYLLLVVMLFMNQAWATAMVALLAVGAWWWFIGKYSDDICTIVMMQPLFGCIGFAAVVPIVAGMLLDVREAAITTLMVALSAIVFAGFGSLDLLNWAIYANLSVAVNPAIAGASMTTAFIDTITSAGTWLVALSWVLASVVFSLLCRKGERTFDILGASLCGVILILGMVVGALLGSGLSELGPLTIAGAVIPALVGVVLAVMSVPDRVRMAPGEW